jgi:Base plate wedge protein 53
MEYAKTSPYQDTGLNRFFLDVGIVSIARDGTEIPIIIEAKYNRRPDLLAYEVYGSSKLWWLFAAVNPDTLKDPMFDFTTGKEIVLLSKERASIYR